MAYTYFNRDDIFLNDIEELINGYVNLEEIAETYHMSQVIGALFGALRIQEDAYNDKSTWNKIEILSAKRCVEYTINEVEELYPQEEFPELWV